MAPRRARGETGEAGRGRGTSCRRPRQSVRTTVLIGFLVGCGPPPESTAAARCPDGWIVGEELVGSQGFSDALRRGYEIVVEDVWVQHSAPFSWADGELDELELETQLRGLRRQDFGGLDGCPDRYVVPVEYHLRSVGLVTEGRQTLDLLDVDEVDPLRVDHPLGVTAGPLLRRFALPADLPVHVRLTSGGADVTSFEVVALTSVSSCTRLAVLEGGDLEACSL